jgi:hypothetical protein
LTFPHQQYQLALPQRALNHLYQTILALAQQWQAQEHLTFRRRRYLFVLPQRALYQMGLESLYLWRLARRLQRALNVVRQLARELVYPFC